jgi:hypothetical protein
VGPRDGDDRRSRRGTRRHIDASGCFSGVTPCPTRGDGSGRTVLPAVTRSAGDSGVPGRQVILLQEFESLAPHLPKIVDARRRRGKACRPPRAEE